MYPHRTTRAEDIAASLQRAGRGGAAVMIPGALEARAGRADVRPRDATAPAVTPHPPTTVVHDLARLEREREGGGAPSERMPVQGRSILAGLAGRLRLAAQKLRLVPAVAPPRL